MIPGTKITVKVDGKPVETYIDSMGTQRFPLNPVFGALYNSSAVDLNNLTSAYQRGSVPFEPYLEFYLGIGYSVSGFRELADFKHLTIENPMDKSL